MQAFISEVPLALLDFFIGPENEFKEATKRFFMISFIIFTDH
jgi:hypothetical protein